MRQQKFSNSSPAIGATKQQPLISGAISHRVSEYIDSITVELISPEVADEYLEHNTHNRPLSVDRVNLYAREMAEGRWQYNADTIRFDKNGVLLNGQHTLHAVKKSGFHALCIVVRDLEPECFDTIDLGGGVRTIAQIAALAGIENSPTVTALARLLLIYDKYDKTFGSDKGGGPAQTEVLEYVKAHHQELAESVRAGRACAKLTSPALIGCCHKIFSRIDSEVASRFFEELANGGTPNTNPTWHLRERLKDNKNNGRAKLERRYILALFFKAWVSYRRDRPMSLLRWRMDGPMPEPFPTL